MANDENNTKDYGFDHDHAIFMQPTWSEAVSNGVGQQLVDNLHGFETEVVSLIKNLKNDLHKPVEQETVGILVYNKQHLCRWVVCYEGS